MKEIKASEITKTVARLCQEANFELGEDVLAALKKAQKTEQSPLGRETLGQLIENAKIAREEKTALVPGLRHRHRLPGNRAESSH